MKYFLYILLFLKSTCHQPEAEPVLFTPGFYPTSQFFYSPPLFNPLYDSIARDALRHLNSCPDGLTCTVAHIRN